MLVVNILDKPSAGKDAIGKPKGMQLKVSVTAAPLAGKETDHMVRFLASLFGAFVATVRIDQRKLFQAGYRHRHGQFGPQPQHGSGLQGERAGKAHVLGAKADGLRGQKQHRLVGGQVRQGAGDDAVDQRSIDIERQVRAMLLDGGHQQHGDAARQVQPRKVGTFHVGPETRRCKR